jgi:hypothetical protein
VAKKVRGTFEHYYVDLTAHAGKGSPQDRPGDNSDSARIMISVS